jgi:hypothetical protein
MLDPDLSITHHPHHPTLQQQNHLLLSPTNPLHQTIIAMVSFRTIITSALAISAPVLAQLSPAQVVTNIETLTQKSQALQAPAQSINAVNGPLIIIGQGPFPVCSTA